ncbi:hypothetical protein NDU88_006597 [Pleurodeles waltl]|uniref:Uncharacterized protein n=1 Tax=Pleurodeles waltl TaxID=8319 RepID=A0AAV7UNH0_PLEWA|nr:hypothetical protein NDU88_006597 [Pleurodeles waltl]
MEKVALSLRQDCFPSSAGPAHLSRHCRRTHLGQKPINESQHYDTIKAQEACPTAVSSVTRVLSAALQLQRYPAPTPPAESPVTERYASSFDMQAECHGLGSADCIDIDKLTAGSQPWLPPWRYHDVT